MTLVTVLDWAKTSEWSVIAANTRGCKRLRETDRPAGFYRLRPVEHPVAHLKQPTPLRENTPGYVRAPRVLFVAVTGIEPFPTAEDPSRTLQDQSGCEPLGRNGEGARPEAETDKGSTEVRSTSTAQPANSQTTFRL